MGNHPAGVLDQVVEEAVLRGAQAEPLAVHDHIPALEIHLEAVVDLDDLVLWPVAGVLETAQHGPDAAGELPGAEGLGHVVVRPQVQPSDAVVLVRAHGEHDHRHIADLPDALQGLEAVQPGHLHVQEHQIRLVVPDLLQGLDSVVGLQRLVAFQIQVHLDEAHHARLIVHHEDLFVVVCHGLPPCPLAPGCPKPAGCPLGDSAQLMLNLVPNCTSKPGSAQFLARTAYPWRLAPELGFLGVP